MKTSSWLTGCRGRGQEASQAVEGDDMVFVALLAEEELAVHGKILFDRVIALHDERVQRVGCGHRRAAFSGVPERYQKRSAPRWLIGSSGLMIGMPR